MYGRIRRAGIVRPVKYKYVIARTRAGNWDEDRMAFLNPLAVRYDLYSDELSMPVTVGHIAFEAMSLKVSWGSVCEDSGGIAQGGAVAQTK